MNHSKKVIKKFQLRKNLLKLKSRLYEKKNVMLENFNGDMNIVNELMVYIDNEEKMLVTLNKHIDLFNYTLKEALSIDRVKIETLWKIRDIFKRLNRYLEKNQNGSVRGSYYTEFEYQKMQAEIIYFNLMANFYAGRTSGERKSVMRQFKHLIKDLSDEVKTSYQPMFNR